MSLHRSQLPALCLLVWCSLLLSSNASEGLDVHSDSKCALTPELVEGPYYLSDTLFRRNITEDQAGVPLTLRVKVVDTDCKPLPDAFVDVWSCNSTGYYSGYTNSSRGPGPGPGPHPRPHRGPHHPNGSHPWHHPNVTDDLVWLRGIVQTDEDGVAEFDTLMPGWYPGRTVHVHLKVHVPYHTYSNETKLYLDSHVAHTGQLFFKEALYKQIETLEPYVHDVHHRVHNDEDHDYQQDPSAVLDTRRITDGSVSMENGFVGSITTVIDPTATPKNDFAEGPDMHNEHRAPYSRKHGCSSRYPAAVDLIRSLVSDWWGSLLMFFR